MSAASMGRTSPHDRSLPVTAGQHGAAPHKGVRIDDLWHAIAADGLLLSRLVHAIDGDQVTYSDGAGERHTCSRKTFTGWAMSARLMARAPEVRPA